MTFQLNAAARLGAQTKLNAETMFNAGRYLCDGHGMVENAWAMLEKGVARFLLGSMTAKGLKKLQRDLVKLPSDTLKNVCRVVSTGNQAKMYDLAKQKSVPPGVLYLLKDMDACIVNMSMGNDDLYPEGTFDRED